MIEKRTAFLLSTPREGVASKMLERGAWMQKKCKKEVPGCKDIFLQIIYHGKTRHNICCLTLFKRDC